MDQIVFTVCTALAIFSVSSIIITLVGIALGKIEV